MSRAPTKAAIAANKVTTFDKVVIKTSAYAGYAVNHASAAIAIAPVGYQAARTKHDLDARVAAARAFAASI